MCHKASQKQMALTLPSKLESMYVNSVLICICVCMFTVSVRRQQNLRASNEKISYLLKKIIYDNKSFHTRSSFRIFRIIVFVFVSCINPNPSSTEVSVWPCFTHLLNCVCCSHVAVTGLELWTMQQSKEWAEERYKSPLSALLCSVECWSMLAASGLDPCGRWIICHQQILHVRRADGHEH